jgi:hypothetical protein
MWRRREDSAAASGRTVGWRAGGEVKALRCYAGPVARSPSRGRGPGSAVAVAAVGRRARGRGRGRGTTKCRTTYYVCTLLSESASARPRRTSASASASFLLLDWFGEWAAVVAVSIAAAACAPITDEAYNTPLQPSSPRPFQEHVRRGVQH